MPSKVISKRTRGVVCQNCGGHSLVERRSATDYVRVTVTDLDPREILTPYQLSRLVEQHVDMTGHPSGYISVSAHVRSTLGQLPATEAPLCQRNGVNAPDPAGASSAPELVVLLRELVVWAGSPSYRALSLRVVGLPKSSLFDMLKRTDRVPPLDLMELLVKACGAGADWPRWAKAHQQVTEAEAEHRGGRRPVPGVPPGWLAVVVMDRAAADGLATPWTRAPAA